MRILVISPHLDDAVLSLGGSMHRWASSGREVHCLTVLAGRPHPRPASWWDATCGFATADEATRTRRQEDACAAQAIGSTVEWLDHADESYGDPFPRPGEVLPALRAAWSSAEVILVPGWPRANPDHAALGALLVDELRGDERVVRYAEQPYRTVERGVAGAGRPPTADAWTAVALRPVDLVAKWRAVGRYRSQLPPMRGALVRQGVHELLRRREWLVGAAAVQLR